MEITVKVEKALDVDMIHVVVPVEYGEEDMPNDFPGRRGDTWDVYIGLNTGTIQNWPKGQARKLHMKVCDSGVYELEAGGVVVARREDYVPGFFPGRHYGDYIIFDIDGDGKIAGWNADADKVAKAFFRAS